MVVAIIAAILLLIALLPLGVTLRYDGQTVRVQANLGAIRLQLLPAKPKKPKKRKPKQPKAQKKAAPQKQQPKKKLDYRSLLGLVRPFFEVARLFLASFRRHLKIKKLVLHVRYGADNPADAAIRYGQAWAVIGCAMPILQSAFVIRRQDVQAIYDGEHSGFSVDAEIRVGLFLFELLGIGTKYGIRAGKLLLPLLKNKMKAVQNS